MNAIPMVSPEKYSLMEDPSETGQWTDVKVKQAWLYSFSGIAMTGAAVAFGVAVSMPCIALLSAALPLAVLSGSMAIYSHSLIDYDDPKILASLRLEAVGMPLTQVVKKHGWAKLFRYSLLDFSHFQSAYRSYANTLSFIGIVDLYRQARNGLLEARIGVDLNAIPRLVEWKEKFNRETQTLGCLAIIDRYASCDLLEFGIITASQQKALDAAAAKRKEFNQRSADLERQFKEATPAQHAALKCAREIAELTYRSHPAHAMLSQIDCDECREIANVTRSIAWRIRQERDCFEDYRNRLMSRCCKAGLTSDERDNLACRERIVNETINRLRFEESSTIGRIRYEFGFRRADASGILSVARQLRDRSIAAAEEQFRLVTQPERRRIDGLHAQNQACFTVETAQIDQEYRCRAGSSA